MLLTAAIELQDRLYFVTRSGEAYDEIDALPRGGDPRDGEALQQSSEVVEAHPPTWAPLVPVGLSGWAVGPVLVVDRQRFDERGDLVVRADTDEVDLIGHQAK